MPGKGRSITRHPDQLWYEIAFSEKALWNDQMSPGWSATLLETSPSLIKLLRWTA
jgi:hypothetical protein